MTAKQLKLPITRHEELHYYTTTRHDTLGSMVTLVASSDAQSTRWRTFREKFTAMCFTFQSRVKHVSSSFSLRWWKCVELVSALCCNWWLMELISWCIGAMCMTSIATLLAAWDGRPLPESFPLGLKLNAYVSVLAAVAKLALAVCLEESLATQKYLWYTTDAPCHSLLDFEGFELAGRRPLGAIKLIWRIRFR